MQGDRAAAWAAWLRAANRGDSRAYAQFLRAVTPVLRTIVRARSGGLGADVVEDTVQEVLMAVHAKRHTWREGEPVQPWLYAITRHKVVDAFRRRGRRVEVPVEDFADVLPAPEPPDPTLGSDMARMIGRLDPRSAEIVQAVGLDGATIREIGARLGMTDTAVRVRLHRALKRLASLREGMIE